MISRISCNCRTWALSTSFKLESNTRHQTMNPHKFQLLTKETLRYFKPWAKTPHYFGSSTDQCFHRYHLEACRYPSLPCVSPFQSLPDLQLSLNDVGADIKINEWRLSIISLDISIFIMQVIHVPCKRYNNDLLTQIAAKCSHFPLSQPYGIFGHLSPFCSHFQVIRL